MSEKINRVHDIQIFVVCWHMHDKVSLDRYPVLRKMMKSVCIQPIIIKLSFKIIALCSWYDFNTVTYLIGVNL